MKNDKINELQEELSPQHEGIEGEEGGVQISIIPSPSTEQPLNARVSAINIMEITTELNASSFYLSFLSAMSKSRLIGAPLHQYLTPAKKVI